MSDRLEYPLPTNATCGGWRCKRPVDFQIEYGPTTRWSCLGHIGEALVLADSEGEDKTVMTVRRLCDAE